MAVVVPTTPARCRRYASNNHAIGRYVWLDLQTLATETASAPLLVVACVDGSGSGGGGVRAPPPPHVRPLESFVDFHVKPSTHLVYAATWASLACAGAVITFKRFLR